MIKTLILTLLPLMYSMDVFSQGHNHGQHSMSEAEMSKMKALPPSNVSGRVSIPLNAVQQQFIGVKTEKVGMRALKRLIYLHGVVGYDETQLYDINIKTSGYIGQLAVNKQGQYVEKGELLLTIYSPELYQAQEELLQAIETQRKLGDPWNTLVEAAKNRLRLWDITNTQIDEIVESGEIKKYLPIYAPISGIVAEKLIFPKNEVKAGSTLLKIANLSQVWLEAEAYEADLPLLKLGQTADLTLSYFPGMRFQAKINFVYPFLDPMTRTVKVRFVIENVDNKFLPGMYATVVTAEVLKPSLVAPNSAILNLGKEKIVYKALGDGVYVPQLIETGFSAEGMTQIIKGLNLDEEIVVNGNFLIDSESQLKSSASEGGMGDMKM